MKSVRRELEGFLAGLIQLHELNPNMRVGQAVQLLTIALNEGSTQTEIALK